MFHDDNSNDWNEYQIQCIKEINNSTLSNQFSLLLKCTQIKKISIVYHERSRPLKEIHVFPENRYIHMKSEIIINFVQL